MTEQSINEFKLHTPGLMEASDKPLNEGLIGQFEPVIGLVEVETDDSYGGSPSVETSLEVTDDDIPDSVPGRGGVTREYGSVGDLINTISASGGYYPDLMYNLGVGAACHTANQALDVGCDPSDAVQNMASELADDLGDNGFGQSYVGEFEEGVEDYQEEVLSAYEQVLS